jgi:type II secretory pathway pseudopilin PulG
MTLVEVLVAIILTSIVTMALVAGTSAIYRGRNFTSQDADSLGALRTAMDRFEKEVRQARRIYSDSTAKRVHLWVDYDRNNQQNPDERIAWAIEDLGGNRAQFTRDTDASAPRVAVRDLVFDAAATDFHYNLADAGDDPSTSTLVTITLVARGQGHLAGERSVRTEVRLRNATAS